MSRISIFFRNTVLLALVAIIFSQCSFSRFARKSFERAEAKKPFDVIIVPGVPYNGARTSSVMNIRLFWAKFLYDSGITKNIIFSGSAVYTPYVEGVAMKIMADSLGVPEWKTFSETRAEHSTENIYYSWKLAKNLGFEKIALASDPFQSRMLKSFIRRYCPQV
ncbi:MAG: YdcF family protein, partial [Bacteroidota bacterium]